MARVPDTELGATPGRIALVSGPGRWLVVATALGSGIAVGLFADLV